MARISVPRGEDKSESLDIAVPVMTGTHFHALDDKGRVIVPAKLRAGLTERFWMILDENDNVAMYNQNTGRDVLEYCEQQMARNPGDVFIAAAVERITGAAEFVVIEGDAWRVSVSDILRLRTGIEKDVVTVGVLNKAVMWSRDRWVLSQEKGESVDVRRAQASMLRAAASTVRNQENAKTTEKAVEEAVREVGNGTSGLATGTDGGASGGERAAGSSASDGRRGARILNLQNIGR